MSAINPLRGFVDKVNHYPDWLSSRLITWVFRFKVKLAGTVRLDIQSTDGYQVIFKQKNRRKVRNHIGSIHAATMALLAESASGFIVGINLPNDKLPLIKTMHLDYVKRCQGDITAVATLTQQQIDLMQSTEKGEIDVQVTITDATGNQPLIAQMIWAWVPKKPR